MDASLRLAFIGLEDLVNPIGLNRVIDDLVATKPHVIVLGNLANDQAYRTRVRTHLNRRDYRLMTDGGCGNTRDGPAIYLAVGVTVVETGVYPFRGNQFTYSTTALSYQDRVWNLVTFHMPLGASNRHRRLGCISHLVDHPVSRDSKPGIMVGNFGFAAWEEIVEIDPREGGWRDAWTLKGGQDEGVSSELGRPHRIYVRVAEVASLTSVVSLPADGTPSVDSEVMRKTLRLEVRP